MLVKIADVYPITYGIKAPAGFGGKPDEKQRLFNRMTHLSQVPHDASYDEFDSGMVVSVPKDSVWCHWLAFGTFPGDYLARETDEAIINTLAYFNSVVIAYKCDRKEFHARRLLGNEQVFEEWLIDYANREGMHVESARIDVLEAREAAARSAGKVGAETTAKTNSAVPRHPFSWYEESCKPLIATIDPTIHDKTLSYEHTRERIEKRRTRVAKPCNAISNPTISVVNTDDDSDPQVNEAPVITVDAKNEPEVVEAIVKPVETASEGHSEPEITLDKPACEQKPITDAPEQEAAPQTPKISVISVILATMSAIYVLVAHFVDLFLGSDAPEGETDENHAKNAHTEQNFTVIAQKDVICGMSREYIAALVAEGSKSHAKGAYQQRRFKIAA